MEKMSENKHRCWLAYILHKTICHILHKTTRPGTLLDTNEWGIAIGISKASAWVVERNQFDTSGTAWNKIQLVIYWQKRECQCGFWDALASRNSSQGNQVWNLNQLFPIRYLFRTTINSIESCAPNTPQQLAHLISYWHLDVPPKYQFLLHWFILYVCKPILYL